MRPPDPATHSHYSDPGKHAELLRDLPDDVESICRAARNVIVHYRAQLPEFTDDRLPEVNSRWLERILDRDQERFGVDLLAERPLTERVAGCCRDHSLFLTGALRERGIAARNRVGFATYLIPGWSIDHVLTEYRDESGDGTRWVRTDPEFPGTSAREGFDPRDLGAGPDTPFHTAAEAWLRYREGTWDLARHAVFPGSDGDMAGPGLARRVVVQLAQRFGDELLLWDAWGPEVPAAADNSQLTDAEIDELATLLIAADGDDHTAAAADDELYRRYRQDDRLHPGDRVYQYSPLGPGGEWAELTEVSG